VLENVERLMREQAMGAKEASIEAMREVSGAIVAIVLVLCAVFVPVAFLGGIAGSCTNSSRSRWRYPSLSRALPL
jgi:HAE1 family hydrophobic/amphiphilic exporter-1/multidrug efflux pump